jgi:Ca2+-binding EF-hand superfamily protein
MPPGVGLLLIGSAAPPRGHSSPTPAGFSPITGRIRQDFCFGITSLANAMLNEEQKADLQEIFNLVDKDNDGRISMEELKVKSLRLLCSDSHYSARFYLQEIVSDLGTELTKDDLNQVIREYGLFIEFTDVVFVIEKLAQQDTPVTRDELLKAFKVFDKEGTGFIPRAEMRGILRHLGNKMSAREAEEIVFLAPGDEEGGVDYKQLIRQIIPDSGLGV